MNKAILSLIYLITISSFSQTPFDCDDGAFYQVISGALKAYDPITGTYSEALHSYTNYNAGGYNPQDNYLYAIKKGDNNLLRIGNDSIQDLGTVTPTGNVIFGGGYAADVDAQGNLWVFQNNTKKTFHKIINLKNYDGSSAPVFEVVEADVTAPSTCADITYINGAFYGGSRGKLFKWNLATGTPVFTSKNVSGLPTSTFGAAYTDMNNRLYLSDNNGGLYLINDYNTASPTATLLNLTAITNANDGFKCASGISPLDKDIDGILDSIDADSDGDGITNTIESNGINPYGDHDDDSMYNYLDNDYSNNGDNVVQDAFDTDRDGIPNFLDIDSDNDGIYDIVEAGQGDKDSNNDGKHNRYDANFNDLDLDGLADAFDPDQTGNPFTPIDSDNDTIYDCYDTDSDNDGIVDLIERQTKTDYQNLSGIDQDRDGMDNAFDPDINGTTNTIVDTDGDNIYDYLDLDSDNDGISDTIEAYDTNDDNIADTFASGNDMDGDGLDDHYDSLKTSFSADNGGQTPNSFPVPNISSRYQYLGAYTADGTPLYLEENDIISQETIATINNALPEGYPVPDFNPHYISSGYDTDVLLQDTAEIWVTFVGEGAGYKNVLGFYTYDINAPSTTPPSPEEITIVFPNISANGSGGGLESGNKVKIGSFTANTGIGWVLLANGWENNVTSGLWQLYSNPNYNPESNAELRSHNVLLADPEHQRIILGFEDIRRDYASCDQDFNDALFYITASPYSAIKTTSFADISSATVVTSGNNGGLESNGDLANLIAKRNFMRAKTNKALDQKRAQKRFTPRLKSYKSGNNKDLSLYFPKSGAFGNETTYVSSPEDLTAITNAKTIFSIDYYQEEKRVAAALATTTVGSIYNHSKTTCDRLNGSSLEDLRTILIRNHTLVSSKMKRSTGEIEHVLHFSIRLDESYNELISLWNIEDYPEGNFINFQVWGASIPQVASIANHIIDQFSKEKKLIKSTVNKNIPSLHVQKGHYRDGKLLLKITNKNGDTRLSFNGKARVTELSKEQVITKSIALTGALYEEVTIEIGYLFDIGFSIYGENSPQLDGLYLADGPWGIDYLDQGVTINSFNVEENTKESTENKYHIERNSSVQGEVKETLNLFRNLLSGELALDISAYSAINFEMYANRNVEIVLVTDDLKDWNDRLRHIIHSNESKQEYTIALSDFKNPSANKSEIKNIKSIVFSVQGDYKTYYPFILEIANLSFIKPPSIHYEEDTDKEIIAEKSETEALEMEIADNSTVKNYPNPFYETTTIQTPKAHHLLHVTVIDITGRVVQQEQIHQNENEKTIRFEAKKLPPGIYQYIIVTDDSMRYHGSFLIH